VQVEEPVHELPAAGEPVQDEPPGLRVELPAHLFDDVQQFLVEARVPVPQELEVVQLARLADAGREERREDDAAVLPREGLPAVAVELRGAARAVLDDDERQRVRSGVWSLGTYRA
jgi:hypothetical protein